MTAFYDRFLFAHVFLCTRVRFNRLIDRSQRDAGQRLNYIKPETFRDKFLWRKIFDRNPVFVRTCDKLAAQRYAREKISSIQTAKLIWRGYDPDEISDEMLADSAVLKANCGSGQAIVITNGTPDRAEFTKRVRYWMSKAPYGRHLGEWPYALGDNCLVLERLLTTQGRPVELEYKFHVTSGRTACIVVRLGSGAGKAIFLVLDRQGNAWTVTKTGASDPIDFELPVEFCDMRTMAEKLAEDLDYVRVDLYLTDDGIYFSELTVFPSSGGGKLGQRDLEELRNTQWDIRHSWFLSTPQRGWRRAYANALRRYLNQKEATR
ncbi:MAG: ATP-grasp fold amidoligase family protein [Pseudomonadota bacterium]